MIPSETVNFARNFAAMVRVRGPVSFSFSLLQRRLLYYHRSLSLQLTFRDPKGLKMRKHAFHQYWFLTTRNLIFVFVSQSFVFYALMAMSFGFLLLGMCSVVMHVFFFIWKGQFAVSCLCSVDSADHLENLAIYFCI